MTYINDNIVVSSVRFANKNLDVLLDFLAL